MPRRRDGRRGKLSAAHRAKIAAALRAAPDGRRRGRRRAVRTATI